MAAALPNLHWASQTLYRNRPKLVINGKLCNGSLAIPVSAGKKATGEEIHHLPETPIDNIAISYQTSRRAGIGLAAIAVFTQLGGVRRTLAEEEANNGFWLTGPLPVPSITNTEIANQETGTRSFLQKGIYIANIGADGSSYRLRQHAFDLLGLGDLMGQDAWSYMRRYLRLKSTVMYYDFDKVISAASVDQKQPLVDLANRLFDNVEKLEEAVKKHSLPMTESYYADTTAVLQEVMTRMG